VRALPQARRPSKGASRVPFVPLFPTNAKVVFDDASGVATLRTGCLLIAAYRHQRCPVAMYANAILAASLDNVNMRTLAILINIYSDGKSVNHDHRRQ